MKKVLAIVLAAVLVLSCSMTAFAEDVASVDAEDGQKVTVDGNVTDSGVYASGEGTTVTVTGNVSNTVIERENAINAEDHAVVEVGGNAESKNGDGIHANGDAQVTVDGDVITHRDSGVNAGNDAGKSGAKVEIKGSINSADYGVDVKNSIVIVHGDITSDCIGIVASGNSEVKVGGNVTDDTAIYAEGNSIILVEGLVTGDIDAGGDGSPSVLIYIGELNGVIDDPEDTDDDNDASKVYYLIGMADEAAGLKEFEYSGVEGAPDGVNGKHYNSVNANGIAGSQITITPKDGKKKIDVSKLELPTGVSSEVKDGVLILKFDENFKGGIQDMLITINDVVVKTSGSGSTYTLFTGTTGNPVTNGKWTQNADGTWSYATAYKFTNTWGCIANPNDANSVGWYYFDRNGNMLTGWQKLYWNGAYKWFYFSKTKDANEGKCQLGGITPDGYRVGPDGAWIEG